MNTKNIISEIFTLDKKRDELKEQISKIYQERLGKEEELANHYGFVAYGLKVGDVIEFEEKKFRKTETFRIKINSFGISLFKWRDEQDDSTYDWDSRNNNPSITGTRILKSGELGKLEATWYSHTKIPFTVISKV